MKFAVGYQQTDARRDPFVEIVRDYREAVDEVYFPWVGSASGRASLGRRRGAGDWTAQSRLEEDLRALREMGVRLDILFNANCYGARAVSENLQNEVGSILDHLADVVGAMDVVTTTSLAIARTVQHYFPEVEVRASVNMRIGDTESMRYVSGLFDSYYLQRDVQRDIDHVRKVKAWCDASGKGLCILANSGCLRSCPGQTFHDNLVGHDAEIDETKNIPGWTPHVCWNLYKDRENWPAILGATWIRPEDLDHYEGLVSVVKLATRMHQNPRMVVAAYTEGSYSGNLLDLLEPGFAAAFRPYGIDNRAFPKDWFERTSLGGRDVEYCKEVMDQVLVRMEE